MQGIKALLSHFRQIIVRKMTKLAHQIKRLSVVQDGLVREAGRKVFLILDNLRVHHSNKVRDWLKKYTEHIEVFFLPAYSPELNPDEYLNCDLKALVHGGKPAKNRDELESKVRGAMMKIQNRPKRVMSYFRHRKIQYAA
ncbi:transposase [Dechloromonas denitrificans]|nr:transposase [Dechloromonas denitrificans]